MELRISALEGIAKSTDARLTHIERDVAVMTAKLVQYATKEDLQREFGSVQREFGSVRAELHKAINDQTWKLITWATGLGAALTAITFFIARNVH